MTDDKHLLLENGHKLQFLPKDSDLYFHKTTLIYGGSFSGKSTILDEIMYLCKDRIPVIFVISSTNTSNNNFTGKVPSHCIMKTLSIEWLENFIQRQVHLTEVHKLTDRIDILKPIFLKVAKNNDIAFVNTVIKRANEHLISIDLSSTMNFAKKKAQKLSITQNRDNTVRKMFKNVIRYNKCRLETMEGFSDIEKTVIEYLDVNPNSMLVFDDVASLIKIWMKKTTLFKKIFYEVRWMSLSCVITAQDDVEVDSSLRKNSMVSFFTTPQSANSNFERSSNNYSKYEKEMAKEAIKTVFKQTSGEPVHHQKFCYLRGDQDPFRYTIADIYDDFKVGCSALWELDKKIGNNDAIDTSNPFFRHK